MPILILLLCVISTVVTVNTSYALSLPPQDGFKTQRELFISATKDISHRRFRAADKKIKQLADYPLLPYAEYQLIAARLSSSKIGEINNFLSKYEALPIANRLRLKAIKAKAKSRQWNDVLALFRVGDAVTYQCLNLRALYHKKDKQLALRQVEKIWLTGVSLPKSCDSLLHTWKKAGYQSESLLWQRIELALTSGQPSLAKYLAKSLSKGAAKTFKYWYKLYAKPQLLAKRHYWAKTGHFATVMLSIATKRLIAKSPDQALDIWPQLISSQRFTDDKNSFLTNKLALKLIDKQHSQQQLWLDKLNWEILNKSQKNRILRSLVSQSRWQDIIFHYKKHQQQPNLGWKYWYATALENQGKISDANLIFQQLATQRRYYGFLASDKLNTPYSLNHQDLKLDPILVNSISTRPAVKRAQELLRLNRVIEARREWYYLLKSLNDAQRIAAAHVADSWQWHNRAIITLTMTQQRDDLNIRFPMPHLKDFQQEAKLNDMALSWPLAISRQESAFMTNARSSAGAMGLMQLMPGTAKQQAKVSKVRYNRRAQLFSPAFNIKLGTGYLAQMLEKFDNNIAVAAAAYNAGPNRAKRWLTKELPQDQWVETIPYRETREYVKNILTYSVIYQHHLLQKANLPSAVIEPTMMKILSSK